MTELRLGIVGKSGVGTSALAIRFVVNRFVDDCDRDVEDCFLMRHSIDEEDYLLDIYNHSDREEFFIMNALPLRRMQGFLLTYDITSRPSFEWLRNVHEHILVIKDEDKVPMILVGNKCDLEEDRQVTTAEGEELASLFGCPMYETSAKNCINVEEPFYDLVREIRKYNQIRDEESAIWESRRKKGKGTCSLF